MFTLDLRWTIFIILLIALAMAGALFLLAGRAARRRMETSGWPQQAAPALERAPFGLLILDGDGSYVYANPYAAHLLDLSPADGRAADGAPADGRTEDGRLPAAAWVDALRQDCDAIWEEIATAGRYRVIALDGERWARWWVTAVGGAEHPLYAVFLQDATAQQQAEQSANRLFSDLSHELRTPIAALLTHLEVLRLSTLSGEQRGQSIDLMQTEAQRMSRLTHALLELGRLQASQEIERRPVDLLGVAEEVVAQMRPQAQAKDIALTLEAHAPLDLILGDAGQIKQVLLNLIDNALKYGRPGDRVTVSLQQQDSGVDCAILDTGPGIPAQHLPRIAQRFYRGAAADREGLGLGLALAQEILRRHQSHLQIDSQAQGDQTGTQVRFMLPRLPEEDA